MWPRRVYTRKKRGTQRLNLTPALEPSAPAKAEAPPGPAQWRGAACKPLWEGRRGKSKEQGLPTVPEKAEHSGRGGSGSGLQSTQLQVTGEKSPEAKSTSEETQDKRSAPKSVGDDLQVDLQDDLRIGSSSSNSKLVSGLNLEHDISSSLLSYSITDSNNEFSSSEESLSSFPSPEVFRGPDCLDYPQLEEYKQYRNSTLLDSSKALTIEKVPKFSNLSTILGISSEDDQKYHGKMMMTVADQNRFPERKSTSNLETDNAACKVLLASKRCLPASEKTKEKIIKSTIPGKKTRGLLTSTPSSQTSELVIDLSSVRNTSFEEELFPNVSNYVNSNEIVPMPSLQEDSSNEIPLNKTEICCIIKASPGTRQVKIKDVTVKKNKYSPCKDIPQDIIISTNVKI